MIQCLLRKYMYKLIFAFGTLAVGLGAAYIAHRMYANKGKKAEEKMEELMSPAKKNLSPGETDKEAASILCGICLSENDNALANSLATMTSKDNKRAALKACINLKYQAMNENMFLSEEVIDEVLDEFEKNKLY